MASYLNAAEQFGSIDIYLFDQLLKGRLTPGMSLLDAGCGSGRNLVYFLRNGFIVSGVDQSVDAIEETRSLASKLAPYLAAENFRVEGVDNMSFASESFDIVVSSAVLHFARNDDHWHAIVNELWRVLRPGGIFFARLSSTIGMEGLVKQVQGRLFELPDGKVWLLVDAEMVQRKTIELDGEWLEPFKTVVVHNKRAMSNWCLRKPMKLS